jgi:hypothetical protein
MEKITPVKIIRALRGSHYRVYWEDDEPDYSITEAQDEMAAFQWAMSEAGQRKGAIYAKRTSQTPK